MGNDERLTEIMDMDLQTAYKLLCAYAVDMPELQEIRRLCRFGIVLQFDIHRYFQDLYTVKAKGESVILIEEYEIPLRDFWTELEEREALMKRNLLAVEDDGDIVHNRLIPEEAKHG